MKASSVMVVSLMLGCNSSKQEIDESRCAYAMTLCTIAGTGTSGYNDINIRATETQLRDPTALVEDADGRLLVSDAGNHQVRRFEDDMLMTVIGRNKNSEAVLGSHRRHRSTTSSIWTSTVMESSCCSREWPRSCPGLT